MTEGRRLPEPTRCTCKWRVGQIRAWAADASSTARRSMDARVFRCPICRAQVALVIETVGGSGGHVLPARWWECNQ